MQLQGRYASERQRETEGPRSPQGRNLYWRMCGAVLAIDTVPAMHDTHVMLGGPYMQ